MGILLENLRFPGVRSRDKQRASIKTLTLVAHPAKKPGSGLGSKTRRKRESARA